MAIFRRTRPPTRRAPFYPPPRSRYVPSKTPAGLVPGAGTLTITGHAPTVTRGTNPPVYGSLDDPIFVHYVEIPGYAFYASTVGIARGMLIPEYLADPGLVRLEAFGAGREPGLVTSTRGDAVYNNTHGIFDLSLIGTPTDGARVTCYVGPPDGSFPGDFNVDYVAYIDGPPRITERTVTFRLRDRAQLFDAQVSPQGFNYALSDAAGTRKRPYAYGTPGYPSPILYLPFADGNVWYVQKNAPTSLDAVYDGGNQLINQGEAASLSDLFTGSAPNPSSYRWFYDDGSTAAENEGTWVRLGSEVRVDLRYRAESGTITISELAAAAGVTGAMADGSADLDVGSRLIETQSYAEVLADVAKATLSIIGLNSADQLTQRYILPATEEDYDTDVTFELGVNSTDWEIATPGGLARRIRELQVNAGATTQGQLAKIPDLDGVAAEAISREKWLTSFVGSSAWVATDDTSPDRMEIDIEANAFAGNVDAMTEFVAGMLALFGSRQVWYWLTVQYDANMAAVKLMDRVTLIGERLVSGPTKGRVISIERRLKDRRIRFGIWVHVPNYVVEPESVAITSIDDASTAGSGSATSRGTKNVRVPESSVIKCGNHNTPVEDTGLVQDIPDFPQSMRFVDISAALTTPQGAGSTLTIDVKINGASVFSTPITIENGEQYSTQAAVQPVLSTLEIARGDNFTVHVTQVGDGTAEGLTVTLTGYQ